MTILFTDGTIRTLEGSATADWMLVDEARVIETGSGDDHPDAERTVTLDGATVIPAFCDAHVHLPATGLYASGMDFRGVTKVEAILDAFRERAADSKAMLFGGNFEDPLDQALNAAALDGAVGGRPALLARADLHSCVASTALLTELELDGVAGVDRDDAGAPTGYLREQAAAQAWSWFESHLPKEQQKDAVRAAVRQAYSKGIGSVHEMFVVEWRGWDSLDIFLEAVQGLALHGTLYLGTDEVDRVVEMGFTRIGGDYFLDGSFGSHTAWMSQPYDSAPPSGSSPTGISYRDDDVLIAFLEAAARKSLQVGLHAIGDAAIEQAVRAWEAVAKQIGIDEVRSLGHRIEHFECATDDQIARAASLGLRASMQPAFDAFWGGEDGLYSERIGWDRARWMNRLATVLGAGIPVGAGSDSTVTPMDPFLQMAAMRSHHVPSESLGPLDALMAHTVGAHSMAGHEDDWGTFAPGRVADLTVLDRDPVGADPEELGSIQVLQTWISGVQVWPLEDAEAE